MNRIEAKKVESFRLSLLLFGLTTSAAILFACKREFLSPRAGALRFSRDTVTFDSLFSTVLSPTQRLWIYNPHNFPVVIRSVRLAGGERSPFSFIIDGREGGDYSTYTLAARDSAQLFIQLRDTTFIDETRIDRLLFETDEGTQAVVLKATLIAAYVYRDFGFDSVVVSLPTDKPIIVDGYFYVGPAATLRILPGTRLYFSGRRWQEGPLQGELASGLYIAGRLEALGTPTAPVRMQGWRLEPYYAQAAGQWQGIWFFPSSARNKITYTHISQTSIGIRIDSAGNSEAPKVYIEGCLIHNAANYGIVVQGFTPVLPSFPILHAVNTLIYRCGQACVAFVAGGAYRLVNCAFIYDQGDLRRGITGLVVTDFFRFPQGERTYPLDFRALNSLIWSSKEDAVAAEIKGTPQQWTFDHCALRQKASLPGTGNIYPSLLGLGSAEEGYPLTEQSPLIDAGLYEAELSPAVDINGKRRDNQPDIGVYEYVR
ncbi:MAG: choice-of-anchor Q domain-containing protein [Bacteroidia bacterium]|nr:right-handed parallel beta-helix repeat-containing protein [Bacteroidia bacterium]MDW8133442.1 choice-of-anchor Q domain-containing protein [Bacteroidia bacterium]